MQRTGWEWLVGIGALELAFFFVITALVVIFSVSYTGSVMKHLMDRNCYIYKDRN